MPTAPPRAALPTVAPPPSPSSLPSSLRATLLALLLVCALGLAALWHATRGFQLVSTEDGRRLDIAEHARALPPAQVHLPQATTLQRALAGDGRIAIVAFIYTSCNAICSVLGSEFQQMQETVRRRGAGARVRLLSISFDPRDTPGALAAYAQRQHADPALWQFVSIDRADQRQALLDTFGIVVVPAPLGEFQHNAAFHIVTPGGRLVRIDDYEQPAQALEHALALAQQADPASRR